jgi:hypothetical protein
MAAGARPWWRRTKVVLAELVFIAVVLTVGIGAMRYTDKVRDDALHNPVATEACHDLADSHTRLQAATPLRGRVGTAQVEAYDEALALLDELLALELHDDVRAGFLGVEGSYVYGQRKAEEHLGRPARQLESVVRAREQSFRGAQRDCVEFSDYSARG